MPIERPDWSPEAAGAWSGGRSTPGDAGQAEPAAPADTKPAAAPEAKPAPQSTREAPAEASAGIDASEMQLMRKLLSEGAFTPEELQKNYALSSEQLSVVTGKAPTGPTVDDEIKAIGKQMRENRAGYFKDEKLQSRYRTLLAAREKGEAAPAEGEEDEKAESGKQADGIEGLDPALIEEWKKAGGVDHHLAIVQGTVKSITDALGEADAAAFTQSFDNLPQAVRTRALRFLSIDGAATSKPASEAKLTEWIESSPEAAPLAKAWGSRAAQRLGAASARLDLMFTGLSKDDRHVAARWLDGLSGPESAALVRGLAGR